MVDLLKNGPDDAPAKIILAHGAGAPMDSDFMEAIACRVARSRVCVLRFEFEYMAGRRISGRKRPPPATAPTDFYRDVAGRVPAGMSGAVFAAGKSMGGRVASLIADDLYAAGKRRGVIRLGYPFHPPGRPDKLRTGHLKRLKRRP